MAAPTPKADAMRALREQRHKAAVAAAAAGGAGNAPASASASASAHKPAPKPAAKPKGGRGKAKPAPAAESVDNAPSLEELKASGTAMTEKSEARVAGEGGTPLSEPTPESAPRPLPTPVPGPASPGPLLAWRSGGNGPGLARRMPELSVPNPNGPPVSAAPVEEPQHSPTSLNIRVTPVWEEQAAPVETAPAPAGEKPKRTAPAALAGPALLPLIAGGVLPLPAVLVLRYKGTEHRAGVNDAGQVVVDGHEPFDSPSRAALSLIDRQTINGWDAWRVESVEGAPKLTALRARLTD